MNIFDGNRKDTNLQMEHKGQKYSIKLIYPLHEHRTFFVYSFRFSFFWVFFWSLQLWFCGKNSFDNDNPKYRAVSQSNDELVTCTKQWFLHRLASRERSVFFDQIHVYLECTRFTIDGVFVKSFVEQHQTTTTTIHLHIDSIHFYLNNRWGEMK